MSLNPWSSDAVTDYDYVFKEFGLSKFSEKISKELDHLLFRRGIVIAHRDFQRVFDRIALKKPFINITGIASSGHYHFGHKVDLDLFIFFKKCGARNYFSISDIDAYTSRPDDKVSSLDDSKQFAVDNVADALALGLSPKDMYVQSNKETRFYEFAFELSKKITHSTFKAIYGHIDLGKVSANLLQYADIMHGQLKEYEGSMPSITGIGLDQDPHARATRDVARRLPYNLELPSFIYFRHQSGLQEGSKMSASQPNTAIFLSDSPKAASKKIMGCFTGGRETAEKQKKLGGRPEICKKYELDLFHLEDDKKLKDIHDKCKAGERLCGQCKQLTCEYVCKFLESHQKKKKKNMKKAEKVVFG